MRRQSVPGHLSALGEWPGGEARDMYNLWCFNGCKIWFRSDFDVDSKCCQQQQIHVFVMG